MFNPFSLSPHMMNMMQPQQMNMNMMDMNAMSMMGMNGMNPTFAAQMNPMLAAQLMGNMGGGMGTVGSMGNNTMGMPTNMHVHQQPMQPMQMQMPMPMQMPMTSPMTFNRFGAGAGMGGDPSSGGVMAATPMQQGGFGIDRNGGGTWMTGVNQGGATNAVGVFPPTAGSGSGIGGIQYWNTQSGVGN